jgi:NAD(P)-dependent dehydrogenase (short-subunit alcohol dehydrogenase family)
VNTLEGNVALITGGASGIGLPSTKQFAAQSAQVVITGRRKQAVDDAIEKIGTPAIGLLGDVADSAHHDMVAAEVVKRFDGPDRYMANAGVNMIIASDARSFVTGINLCVHGGMSLL